MEKKSGATAVDMREAVFSEVPEQNGNFILTFFEVCGKVDFVIIGVMRIGPSLEPPLEHYRFAINPKPVLGVGSNGCYGLPRHFVEYNILTESNPGIGFVNFFFGSGYPIKRDVFFPLLQNS